MNQSALNLIAISIFAMTLSTLLSPLLNISPFVPAVATFGILGLATIDSFQWQGQLGSIVLDWVAGFSSTHRDRVLHHEAGHFLVAQQLDIPVVGYTLSAWEAFRQKQPGQGGVQFSIEQLDAELQQGKISAQWVDRYCTVWMAGIAAEQLIYGNSEGGNDDRQKLQLLLRQIGISPPEAAQRERLAILRAKTVLEQQRSAYGELVDAFKERKSVEACYAAIDKAQAV